MTAISSRVGRKPVAVPAGVVIEFKNHELAVKGPKGNLTLTIPAFIDLNIQNNQIEIKKNNKRVHTRKGSEKKSLRSSPGTTRANINNAILGVSKGFERKLNL